MRRLASKKTGLFVFITAFLFLTRSFATDTNIRQTLFNEADKVLEEARGKQADLYSPKSFGSGMTYYAGAEEGLNKGTKNIKEIQKDIEKAVIYFKRSLKNTEVGAVVFAKTMKARQDALKAMAEKYAPENWKKAEKEFNAGAETLEDGDSKSAKTKSIEAELSYRDAELKSIQSRVLQDTWTLIHNVNELNGKEYAPFTLNEAVELAGNAAQLIEKNRYDLTEAEKIAAQANAEAAHALYLTNAVREGLDKKKSYENVLLETESPIRKVARILEVEVQFDKGTDSALAVVLEALENLVAENKSLRQEITEKDSENFMLKSEISTIKMRLGKTDSMNKELQEQARKEQLKKEKLISISKSFTKDEGVLVIRGRDIILRLYGVSFPQGKAIIEPKYFSLLTRVKKVIDSYPGSKVTVEGHTDASGSDELNYQLSNSRAEAVKEYLLADGAISRDRISAVGYGESRPVASNGTKEERAKNRRIDVVIQSTEDF